MDENHIHVPDDGRGIRDVFVDGKKYEHVFYADTKEGFVDYYLHPFQVDHSLKQVKSKRVHGKVQVVPCG